MGQTISHTYSIRLSYLVDRIPGVIGAEPCPHCVEETAAVEAVVYFTAWEDRQAVETWEMSCMRCIPALLTSQNADPTRPVNIDVADPSTRGGAR